EAPRRVAVAGGERVEEQDRREQRADLDHEHDRVAGHVAGIELLERIDDRAPHDRGLEQRAGPDVMGRHRRSYRLCRCSTIGPRPSAGRKVSAPTRTTTPTSRNTNNGPSVGKVPDDGGTYFFLARLPAIASTGIAIQKRPIHMQMPCATVQKSVVAF